MLEVLITFSVLMTCLMFFASSVVRLHAARVTAEEDIEATAVVDRAMTRLRSMDATTAVQDYAPNIRGEAFPAPGSGPGTPFVAPRLNDANVPGTRAQVSIQFHLDETENLPGFGLPRDLDGDGVASNVDASRIGADGGVMARLVPFTLSLNYRGQVGGARTMQRACVLARDVMGEQ